jgi:hypothetical protein
MAAQYGARLIAIMILIVAIKYFVDTTVCESMQRRFRRECCCTPPR